MNGTVLLFTCLFSFLILKNISTYKMDSITTLANVKALSQNDKAVFHNLAFDMGHIVLENLKGFENSTNSKHLLTI